MKRQLTEWEKIFANYMTDKGLISKICKKLIQLNIKKQIIQFKNGQTFIWIDIFPKETYREPTDTWKNAQKSQNIRKTQIKTTIRYHITCVRMAVIKKTNNKCWQGCGEKESSCIVGENVNWYNHYWKQYDLITVELPYILSIPLLGI